MREIAQSIVDFFKANYTAWNIIGSHDIQGYIGDDYEYWMVGIKLETNSSPYYIEVFYPDGYDIKTKEQAHMIRKQINEILESN